MGVWTRPGTADLKAMNPLKTLLVAATNTVAVLCFTAADAVRWPETSAVLLAALVGGYGGARAGSCLGPRLIRAAVVSITAGVTTPVFSLCGGSFFRKCGGRRVARGWEE